jgi:2-haloacid dehalogenase
MRASDVKALVFDVFGTVVDWRASVIREGEALGKRKGFTVDWPGFADEWRIDGYIGGMERIRRGELPWMKVDALHRRKLDELLVKYDVTGLTEAEIDHFNRVWHRLIPWPDSVEGLTRLRERFIIATLSNGDVALLTNMAKAGKLPWDCILSSELFQAFKPDPRVYLGAANLLGLEPSAVLMVAAHGGDLRAARALGLRTAFVSRPGEWGPHGRTEPSPDPAFDVIASDFVDLAEKLENGMGLTPSAAADAIPNHP